MAMHVPCRQLRPNVTAGRELTSSLPVKNRSSPHQIGARHIMTARVWCDDGQIAAASVEALMEAERDQNQGERCECQQLIDANHQVAELRAPQHDAAHQLDEMSERQ
jgi:hypothetical protein